MTDPAMMEREQAKFTVWLCRDVLRGKGWHFGLILLPWPVEDQEVGHLIRALANVSVCFWAWGVEAHRYCPNRAEHWLLKNGATP